MAQGSEWPVIGLIRLLQHEHECTTYWKSDVVEYCDSVIIKQLDEPIMKTS